MTIFERIVNKEIPAYVVYEDDLVLAFLDIQQTTKGHTLVISKRPYKDIYDMPEDLFKHLMGVVKHLANSIDKAFHPKGINIINNNGSSAGQTVFHYHVHLIPRYDNDDLSITYKDNSGITSDLEYKKRAFAISKAQLWKLHHFQHLQLLNLNGN